MQIKLKNTNDTESEKEIDCSYNSEIDDLNSLCRQKMSIDDLLIYATEHNCSDLYIKVNDSPYISRYGKIVKVPCAIITKDIWSVFYDTYILNELNADYVRQKLLDTSVMIRIPDSSSNFGKYATNYYRYRVSFGFSEERNIATFRMIKPDQPTFNTINFNPKCIEALRVAYAKPSGICYCTGPTGSGKSTTMAACINSFTTQNNVLDNKVIITLEDPIENIFSSTNSVKINQKELGKDFTTFALGIKAGLREHPNIIIIGEGRDKEVLCATIEAARCGHLTVSTFHSPDVAGTVSRLLYHLDNDKNLSLDLIMQLNIIMSQRMIKQDDRYLVDTQYLLFTDIITKKLIEIIEDSSTNVVVEIQKLFSDPILIANGTVKNWDYSHLH